jgi:CBS domain-containing protein
MKVHQIMTPTLQTVSKQDSLKTAAQTMRDVDVGALPVRDEQGLLFGLITDRDIVVRAIAEGRDPAIAPVADAMTCGALSCTTDSDVEQAAKLMEQNQVRRLIVLDGNNEAAGIVSLADIAVKSPNALLAGEVVENVSKPAQPALGTSRRS